MDSARRLKRRLGVGYQPPGWGPQGQQPPYGQQWQPPPQWAPQPPQAPRGTPTSMKVAIASIAVIALSCTVCGVVARVRELTSDTSQPSAAAPNAVQSGIVAAPVPSGPPPTRDQMMARVVANGCPTGRLATDCDDRVMLFDGMRVAESVPEGSGYNVLLVAPTRTDSRGMSLAVGICNDLMVDADANRLPITILRVRGADQQTLARGRPGRCVRGDASVLEGL